MALDSTTKSKVIWFSRLNVDNGVHEYSVPICSLGLKGISEEYSFKSSFDSLVNPIVKNSINPFEY